MKTPPRESKFPTHVGLVLPEQHVPPSQRAAPAPPDTAVTCQTSSEIRRTTEPRVII